MVPAQIFPTADGWLTLFITHDKFWQKFCVEVGQPDWITDPMFATMASRRAEPRRRARRHRRGADADSRRPNGCAGWRRSGVVVAEVGTLAQALDSELARSRDLVVQLGEGEHPLRAVGSPVKFEGFAPRYGTAAAARRAPRARCWGRRRPDARAAAGPACAGARRLTRAGQRRRIATCCGSNPPPTHAHHARRIGLTGAPGAGKSTLAGHLALHRARDRRLGVLAVDPSSPKSGGAILGDRIRMDELDGSAELYIRSIGSRSTSDGLSDNLPEMLDLMDAHGFDEVLLETVGVGQAEYAARVQVDTLVLVLLPESGDVVQAMKAGIMEMADIFVVNKADLPGAQKMATDIKRISAMARHTEGDWRPTVLLASCDPTRFDCRALGRDRPPPGLVRRRRSGGMPWCRSGHATGCAG